MILKKLVAHCSVGFAKVIAESVNFWQKKRHWAPDSFHLFSVLFVDLCI